MRISFVKNGLVVGVILLFVGVAVQPVIAVNPISTDNEEDCSICPKVSKQHLVRLKRLLNRFEKLNNKFSVISKYHPGIVEKYQELSDRITTFTEINKKYVSDLSWDFPIICSIITIIITYQLVTIIFLANIIEDYNNNQIISSILRIWYAMRAMIGLSSIFILIILNCPQL